MTNPYSDPESQAAILAAMNGGAPPPGAPLIGGPTTLPPGVGDEGSPPVASAPPPVAPPPPPPPAFSPAVIDALYAQGKLTPEQYTSMGGNRPLNAAAPVVAPAVQQQVAAAPIPAQQQAQADAAAKARLASAVVAPPPQAAPVDGTPPSIAAPAPVARPRTTPEHWVNTLDPVDRQMLETGEGAQLDATDEKAKADAAASDEIARVAYHGQEQDRTQQLLDQQEADAQRKQIEQHMADLQQRAQDIANQKIQPDHWMHQQSTGQRIGLAIARGLGAYAAAKRGGPNGAAQVIDGEIDNDIKAQAANIENSKEGLKTATGLLADKWRLFDNKDKAMAAARQEALQATASEIDATARKYQSPAIMAQAQNLKGELLQRFASAGASINKYVPAATSGGARTEAEIAKYEADLVKSGRMEPNEAHAEALRWGARETAENPSQFYVKPTANKNATDTSTLTDLARQVKSTNWHPERHLQGTEAQKNLMVQQRWNSQILAMVHKSNPAARGLEAMHTIGAPYLLAPGDTQSTMQKKTEAALRDFGPKAAAEPAADESAPVPDGFEEAK